MHPHPPTVCPRCSPHLAMMLASRWQVTEDELLELYILWMEAALELQRAVAEVLTDCGLAVQPLFAD